LKKAPKSQNNSKFIKKTRVVEQLNHRGHATSKKIKTDELGINIPIS
jgi:hypothetical protein